MTLRAAKTALVFAVALFYSLIVFSNISDYDSNYQFIRHVSDDGLHLPQQSRHVARN
jgi:predicted small integral membrane protein